MNPLAEERDVNILEDTISQTKLGRDSETHREEQIANLGMRLCREIELVALVAAARLCVCSARPQAGAKISFCVKGRKPRSALLVVVCEVVAAAPNEVAWSRGAAYPN